MAFIIAVFPYAQAQASFSASHVLQRKNHGLATTAHRNSVSLSVKNVGFSGKCLAKLLKISGSTSFPLPLKPTLQTNWLVIVLNGLAGTYAQTHGSDHKPAWASA
jgi:hypothetical protein